MNDSVVIVSFARTPIGNLLGELKDFSAPMLGAKVLEALYVRASLAASDISEVIMGCVLPAGLGQAPARQAALAAGLPHKTPCTTINKVCGSGMKAVIFAYNALCVNPALIIAAGGMESMTNAPHLLKKARQGYRLGAALLEDHMMLDGLQDAYEKDAAMGVFAERCALQYGFSRQEQDEYAMRSFERARFSIDNHLLSEEMVPLTKITKEGERIILQDEHPFSVNLERITTLKPTFAKEGTITPGNSSSIADGAASLLIMRRSEAEKRHLKPLAKIVAYAEGAKAPSDFPTAPIDVTLNLMNKIGWSMKEVDLFEVNEAFAVVALAIMRDLKIPPEKLNVRGGACALGHPIGATGARIIVTLLAALKQKNLKRGIASLCIGGGEATAIAIEMC